MSKSFVCDDLESVSCPSSWQTERSCQESSAQTVDVSYVDKGDQSKSSNSVEVQTDSAQQVGPGSVDMTKLGAWLSRITPRVLQELEKGCKSHVFDEYKLQEDSTDLNIKHLFTLSKEENDSESNFITSAVEWSSTGGIIAVSRCAREHRSWCEHSGNVSLHNTNRQELKSHSRYRSLDVTSCVTVLAAHPNDSFILACGTFSGEVIVWNLQRDEPTVIGSFTLHTEAIAHMEWVQSFDNLNMRPSLASISRDGSVIIWSMKSTSGTLKPSQCFLLQAEKENLDLGIVCAKFNPSAPNLFLAGIEGGSLAICSVDSKRPCFRKRAPFSQEIDCCDPIQNVIDGHKGTITGVQWVPGSSDLFLSCGTDSELHVYSYNEVTLLRVIFLPEPSCGLEICSSHPNLAATWGSSGSIHLHDIHNTKELLPLNLSEGNAKPPLSVVRIRTSSMLLFALGDIDGNVSVWQVPHKKLMSSSD